MGGRHYMGASWNPNGGMVVSDKKLTKEKVAEVKRKWSDQLVLSEGPFDGWWRKFKRMMMTSFQMK